jgi:zinc protease
METPKTYIFLAYNGYDKYSLKKDIVSDMCGQILRKIYTRTIREEAGISYAVQADASYNYSTRDGYMLEVICPVKPAKADSALLLIRQGLEQVAAAGPDAKDLEDVKKYELKAYADRQLSNGYWSRLINSMVCYGQDGQTDYVKTVNSVTPDDIRSFLRDTAMKQNNKVTVIMMPADLTDKQ